MLSEPVRIEQRRWFDAPPERPALITNGHVWTAAECRTSAAVLAKAIQGALPPIVTGQLCRIVIYGSVAGTTCLAWLAAQLAGAVVTVLDDRLPSDWSTDFVRRIEPQLVLHDAAYEARAAADAPDAPRLHYSDVLEEVLRSFRAGLVADSGPISPRSGPATTIYSSGSTGGPKEVLLSHEALSGIASLDELWGPPTSEGVVAVVHPLSMLSGPNVLTGAWRNGRTVVTYDVHRDGLDGLVTMLLKAKVTHLLAQTAVVRSILRAGSFRDSSLRMVAVGGEPFRVVDLERFGATLPNNVELRVVFGMSECPLVASAIVDASTDVTKGLRFRPHSDVEIELVDDDGAPVPLGAIGELRATSPRIADGYVRNGSVVTERFVDIAGTRWFQTGDCARLSTDGTFELCGRVDSRLKIRGYNVYPEAVEAALGLLPSVRESVVVGSERPGGGTMLTAFVVPATAPSPSIGELRRVLRASMPDYCTPSVFVFSDLLPSLPNGKRDRPLLRSRASAIRFELRTADVPRNDRERAVERLVAELLGLDAVGVDDDLLNLGMDSLMLAELAVKIAPAGGRAVAVASIVRTPTVSAIAALLPDQVATSGLVRLADGPGSLRVVLVPGAGAAIAYLRPLAERLAERVMDAGDVLAYVAGDAPSVVEEARRLVESVASLCKADCVPGHVSDRPIVLIGHSWGGLVAHDAARQLRALGRTVRLLVMLDSKEPSRVSHRAATARRLVSAIRPNDSPMPIIATDRAHASLIGDRRFDASVDMAARHRARRADVDALLIRGTDSESPIDSDRWHEVVGSLRIEDVTGSHTSLLVEPFLSDVVETISRHL